MRQKRGQLRCLGVPLPVLDGADADVAFEQFAEGSGVGIAHFVHDFLDGAAALFQVAFGRFDAGPLQVRQYGVTRGVFEAALQGPAADAQALGEARHVQLALVFSLDDGLRFEDDLVVVIFLPFENDERRLRFAAHIDLKKFGAVNGRLAVHELLDDVQNEHGRGECAPAGVYSLVLGEDAVAHEYGPGKELFELILRPPVGGAFSLVEQSGASQDKRAEAQAEDLGTPAKLLGNPGVVRPVRLHGFPDFLVFHRWDDDDIRALSLVDGALGPDSVQTVIQLHIATFAEEFDMKSRGQTLVDTILIGGEKALTRIFKTRQIHVVEEEDGYCSHENIVRVPCPCI